MMYYTGIDIGSTASKVVVLDAEKMVANFVIPTGWNSKDTSREIARRLKEMGYPIDENNKVLATGYGRVSVDYAQKVVTEITCHGRGGYHIVGEDCTIIDIGGQDTKVITVEKGVSTNFLMNDKCAAGTGKFLEIMANRLNVTLGEMYEMAAQGTPLAISAMCTVFAESEVISHIGSGERREDIAAGVVESVVKRVAGLVSRHAVKGKLVLTGGLSECDYVIKSLSQKVGREIYSDPLGRYAGALGAALIARDGKKVK